MARPKGHGIRLSHYDFGATTVYAARDDKRFSYCCYVPEAYEEEGTPQHPLVFVVHGTERGMTTYRDRFTDLAEETGAIILAPLFPAGMTAPGELSSYKMIREGGIAYDTVLLGMVAEVEERYRIADGGFCLYGFSGGGHFAHRCARASTPPRPTAAPAPSRCRATPPTGTCCTARTGTGSTPARTPPSWCAWSTRTACA